MNNVQYTESQSYSCVGVIKVHFQPSVQVDLAIAQVTALAQSVVHLMPPGTLPPFVLKYDASSVQVSLGGEGLSQTELYDLGQNFIRGAHDYSFAGGHQQSIGMSAGLLIGIR